ncbi:L-threonine 3-dehydrogenase [Nocardia sp. RB56]|uniref:L-threonine 3-dehydrogenase n=2 Tax=Nocardia aurantia TaxID=2585199 RepID=A0A7K0DU30_9NOCA|nr:L-threonine 3-dehydrogenase [Nocardia aurantia]
MLAAHHVSFGAPLVVSELPRPVPLPGEVRIKVAASGVNPIDAHTGRGNGYVQSMKLPFVPGWDVAGVVDAVGYGVTRHRVGDPVFGLAWFPYPAGTYAEYATVPAHHVVPVPAGLGPVEAAALPLCGLTAWQMLRAAKVERGQRVVIDGASGGVGHLAVQIAHALGAEVVALARSEHHSLVASWGADECVDYRDDAAVAAIGTADALCDVVGGGLALRLFDRIAEGGCAALALGWAVPNYRAEAAKRGIEVAACLVEPDPEGLQALSELVAAGSLRVHVGATFALAEADRAQQWVTDRSGIGKAVLVMPDRAE